MSRFTTKGKAILRGKYLQRIRLIGDQKYFENITLSKIVFVPERSVFKLRNATKKKQQGNNALQGFAIVVGNQLQLAPKTSTGRRKKVNN